MKKQIGMNVTAEARYCRSVNRYSVTKRFFKLVGHNGYVLLLAIDIRECKTNKLNILFLNILHYFIG